MVIQTVCCDRPNTVQLMDLEANKAHSFSVEGARRSKSEQHFVSLTILC